jgi:hypothetical protein
MTIGQQNYASGIRTEVAQLSAANPNRDGTGTIVNVFTAGSAGSRIDDITISPAVTTTAGMVRFFIHDGANTRFWREFPIAANTLSATNPAISTLLSRLGLVLKAGYSLRASTEKAEAINVVVTSSGDF